MRKNRLVLVLFGTILLVLLAGLVCVASVGFGAWLSRASLGLVPPPVTPTVLPGPPTALPIDANPSQVGIEVSSSAPPILGLPQDIPLPENADPQSFVGMPDQYSFMTSLSYDQAVEFYREKLPDLGWQKIDYGTRLGEASAELHYRKEDRILTVRIVDLPYIGRLVEVSLQV